MMVFTHGLVGILFGATLFWVSPASATPLFVAGFAGGVAPDIDMLFVHRRTLHFPVLSSVLAVALAVVSAMTGSGTAALLLAATAGSAAHCVMDTLGGGKEMRPWRETDDRAVYDHVRDQWIAPRRLFYDGSLPDLGLSVITGGAVVLLLPARFTVPVVVLVALAVVYVAFRRAITRWIPEKYDTFSGYLQSKLP